MRLLIVKVGSAPPERPRQGDFDDWIQQGCNLAPQHVTTVDPTAGDPLPRPDALSAVIVTGSAAMVSEREPWSERTAVWLGAVVESGIPTFGICYGHQLIAHGLGGTVGSNPRGREMGTISVHRTGTDPGDFLGDLPNPLVVQATHVETVLAPPPQAHVLATSDLDACQVLQFGPQAWGVQFHPEFNAAIMRHYIQVRQEAITAEGLNADALHDNVVETDHGTRVLRRFIERAKNVG